MKKRRVVTIIFAVIMAGFIFSGVLLTKKPFDASYAYPRFDGYWYCLNTPTPELVDKEWQYTMPLWYKSSDSDVPITIRNKYGRDDESYTAKVRVISPDNKNFSAERVLQGNKTLSLHFPANFDNQQELQSGIYTYEWTINGKFILCSGFVVNPVARDKPLYRYEISLYGIQYLPSFLGKASCDTVRIAGQVHNNVALFDDAIEGLKIQLTGNGVDMRSFTGSKKEYGRGGYEFILPKQASGTQYDIQVFDFNNQVASEKISITVFSGCDKNLAWVNLEQVILGQ